MGTLKNLSAKLSKLGVEFKYVKASGSEVIEDDELNGMVWGLVDEGVNGDFVGEVDKKRYIKILFTDEIKESFEEEGYDEDVTKYAGAILTFVKDDGNTDEEPEEILYFDDEEELDAEFDRLEEENMEEVADDNEDGEITFNDFLWFLVDHYGVDETVGDETDGVGQYSKLVLTSAMRKRIAARGFEDDLGNIEGAIVFFRQGAEGEENEERVDLYENGDLDEAWEAAKEEQASYQEE